MQPIFKIESNEFILLCPSCKSSFIHHGSVEIFERKEDEEKGIHVVVNGGRAIIDNSMESNPSSRRNGLVISFWCEMCSETGVFKIVQHKGQTFIDFNVDSQNK